MSRVLVIGDVHEPATHPAYLDFVTEIGEQWGCDRVHFIGDIIDHHAISFHARHPDAPGPKEEYALAMRGVQKWYSRFPNATVSVGNHDERVIRLAASVNIPRYYLREYSETWKTPGWQWHEKLTLDGVLYTHGTGNSGHYPAYNVAKNSCCSVVMGHVHQAAGVKWLCGPKSRIFGCDTGCGVDVDHIAMDYGKNITKKPVIACAVVLDGVHPIVEICPCGPGERFHRSRFIGRRRRKSAA